MTLDDQVSLPDPGALDAAATQACEQADALVEAALTYWEALENTPDGAVHHFGSPLIAAIHRLLASAIGYVEAHRVLANIGQHFITAAEAEAAEAELKWSRRADGSG